MHRDWITNIQTFFKMAKKEDIKIAIAPTIRALKKGKTAVFPIARYNTVRNTCTNISITEPYRYSTSLDREAGTVTVTRTA